MGVQLEPTESGSGSARERNVELNVVPFIDLMSCMTAFLLVTAVWSHLAQVPTRPRPASEDPLDEHAAPRLSVLVTEDGYWLGAATGDVREMTALADLDQALRQLRSDDDYARTTAIEIAAEDDVPYAALVATMDTAIAASFDSISVMSPTELSIRARR